MEQTGAPHSWAIQEMFNRQGVESNVCTAQPTDINRILVPMALCTSLSRHDPLLQSGMAERHRVAPPPESFTVSAYTASSSGMADEQWRNA